MHLDVVTLMVVHIGFCAILGAWLLLRWWMSEKPHYLLVFASAFLLVAVAYVLLALRGRIPDWLSIFTANAILLTALGICWNGFRLFNQRRARWVVAFVPVWLWGIACSIPPFYNSFALRTVFIWTMVFLFCLSVAHEVWIRGADRLSARRLIGVVCVAGSLICVLRVGYALTHLEPGVMSLTDTWSTSGTLLSLFVIFGVTVLCLGLVQQRTESALRQQAARDGLTGLLNRSAFIEQAGAQIAAAARNEAEIVLLLFDLDRFKSINDTYGHAAGDAVLVSFADILRKLLNEMTVIGRIGGEEFAALLIGVDARLARQIAERVRAELARQDFECLGASVATTVSVGLARSSASETDLAQLMARSDSALYAAKRGGRDLVRQAAG